MSAARVDTAAVRAIAREYDTVAAIVDDVVRRHLGDVEFGAASAGRAYAAHGDTVREALAGLAVSLRQWSRAATEISVALRAAADRYEDADARAAGLVG